MLTLGFVAWPTQVFLKFGKGFSTKVQTFGPLLNEDIVYTPRTF